MHSMGSMHVSRHNRKALALQKGKKSNSSGLTTDFTLKEADTVFGRPSEWTSPVADIETGRHLGHQDSPCTDYHNLVLLQSHRCSGQLWLHKAYRYTGSLEFEVCIADFENLLRN